MLTIFNIRSFISLNIMKICLGTTDIHEPTGSHYSLLILKAADWKG